MAKNAKKAQRSDGNAKMMTGLSDCIVDEPESPQKIPDDPTTVASTQQKMHKNKKRKRSRSQKGLDALHGTEKKVRLNEKGASTLADKSPIQKQQPPKLQSNESSTESSEEGDEKSEYIYKDLKVGQIRILVVHPGAKGSDLDCSLIVRAKEEAKDYEALSYVWGGQVPEHPIRIRGKSTGTSELKVTTTLRSALKQLRSKIKPRNFWADAVCINQLSDVEKSQQVPLMSQIYSEATNICVWLGDGDSHSTRGMKLAQQIRALADFERVVEESTTCEDWEALIDLMRRPWFSRRWVVQEIALAKQATIHCGKAQLPWSEFSEAIALFQELVERVNQKFKEEKRYNNHPDWVGDVKAYSACQLVEATNNVVRKSPDGLVLLKIQGLEYLVSTLTSFEATEPHDIVYAVLSLAKDIPGASTVISPTANITTTEVLSDYVDGYVKEKDLNRSSTQKAILGRTFGHAISNFRVNKYPVDYSKSLYEVCKDFLEFTTKASRSLDIICRPWAPVVEGANLPSWIRSLREKPFGKRQDQAMSRRSADVLVGPPGENNYSASGKYPGEWKFSADMDKRSLSVMGFVLDVVRKKRGSALAGVVPETWFDLGGWTNHSENPPDPFWRTMVANRPPKGTNPPPYYPLVSRHALLHRVENSDVDTAQIYDRSGIDIVRKWIRRVQSVIWKRRLVLTKTHKFLALTPDTTSKGDLVCILLGCSVPVLLRKCNHQGIHLEGESCYKFIGESYVHGMMDGEAFEIKKQQKTEYETFQIF